MRYPVSKLLQVPNSNALVPPTSLMHSSDIVISLSPGPSPHVGRTLQICALVTWSATAQSLGECLARRRSLCGVVLADGVKGVDSIRSPEDLIVPPHPSFVSVSYTSDLTTTLTLHPSIRHVLQVGEGTSALFVPRQVRWDER